MSSAESEKTQSAPTVSGRCVVCRQVAYYKSGTESESNGHIWDEKGLRDFHQIRMCQGCVNNTYHPSKFRPKPPRLPGPGSGIY